MRAPVPSRRQVSVLAWVVVVAVLALVLWMLATLARVGDEYDRLEQRADSGKADRAQLWALVEQQDAALGEANQRLREMGVPPVTPPATPPTTSPSSPLSLTGPRGPMGPMGPQGARGPSGKDGADGSDGRSVTGEKGETGSNGGVGPQGPQGPQGEAGPAGKDGKDGKDGAAGPAGSVAPGTYACDTGYVVGFTVAADGSVTLDCAVVP